MNPIEKRNISWQGRRPRAVLLGLGDRPDVRDEAHRLLPVLQKHVDIVLSDFDCCQDLSPAKADLAVVLGGDGSILRAANQMGHQQMPVLGVNMGRLGFLADLSLAELLQVLPDVCAGEFRIVDHLMFHCCVWRDDNCMHDCLGLNEVSILGGPPYSLLDIDLYVDGDLVTTYSCDGLIVSTPVGSTAHSLSAGGPILRKDLQAFVVSPISPHTLTVRPLVDSADCRYELVVRKPHNATSIVVDGRPLHVLQPSDRVSVSRASCVFQLIEVRGHNYYRTLREKLSWGGHMRRIAEEPR